MAQRLNLQAFFNCLNETRDTEQYLVTADNCIIIKVKWLASHDNADASIVVGAYGALCRILNLRAESVAKLLNSLLESKHLTNADGHITHSRLLGWLCPKKTQQHWLRSFILKLSPLGPKLIRLKLAPLNPARLKPITFVTLPISNLF